MHGRILVLEDDRLKRLTLEKQLGDAGYAVAAFDNAFAAVSAIQEQPFDVAITDLKMPGMDGLEFLRKAKALAPNLQVIVMTAYGSIETAVAALRAGAYDYLTKPFTFEEIEAKLLRLVEHVQAIREIQDLKERLGDEYRLERMVARSKPMRDVFDRARLLADRDVNVLILGETGTGKELLARGIHASSPRAQEPFVAVNCAVLNPMLLESELFGHEAGAFTGATRQKRGRIELAGKGTLFLDDIDDLPLEFQVKLLRVLQEREYERVGGESLQRMAARLVCAVKRDLRELVNEGKFREDLMYRIDVVCLTLPPLRERKDDIPLLVAHFSKSRHASREFPPEIMKLLMDYDWPGNVRELENVVSHIHAVAQGSAVTRGDLPAYLLNRGQASGVYSLNLAGQESIDLPALLHAIEQECVHWAMVRTKGRRLNAAEMLCFPRTSLRRFLDGDGPRTETEDRDHVPEPPEGAA